MLATLPPSARVPEMDQAKGFAILAVVCIHARVFEGTPVHEHVVDRAVPLLLVLFGLGAELSWRRAETAGLAPGDVVKRWYARRLARLLPGLWAALATCFATEALLEGRPPSFGALLGALLGYAPQFGSSWFAILILQVALLFPLVRAPLVGAGRPAALALGALISGASIYAFYDIVAFGQRWLGADEEWYYHWIFVPRVCFHVVVGMTLAGGAHRIGRRGALLCGALVLATPLIVPAAHGMAPNPFVAPLLGMMAAYVLDVPLVLLLLWGMRALSSKDARSFFAWCGARTWGIYLGHVVLFEVAHLLGLYLEMGGVASRMLYALGLLGGGAVLSLAGERARDRALARAGLGALS